MFVFVLFALHMMLPLVSPEAPRKSAEEELRLEKEWPTAPRAPLPWRRWRRPIAARRPPGGISVPEHGELELIDRREGEPLVGGRVTLPPAAAAAVVAGGAGRADPPTTTAWSVGATEAGTADAEVLVGASVEDSSEPKCSCRVALIASAGICVCCVSSEGKDGVLVVSRLSAVRLRSCAARALLFQLTRASDRPVKIIGGCGIAVVLARFGIAVVSAVAVEIPPTAPTWQSCPPTNEGSTLCSATTLPLVTPREVEDGAASSTLCRELSQPPPLLSSVFTAEEPSTSVERALTGVGVTTSLCLYSITGRTTALLPVGPPVTSELLCVRLLLRLWSRDDDFTAVERACEVRRAPLPCAAAPDPLFLPPLTFRELTRLMRRLLPRDAVPTPEDGCDAAATPARIGNVLGRGVSELRLFPPLSPLFLSLLLLPPLLLPLSAPSCVAPDMRDIVALPSMLLLLLLRLR